MYDCVTHQFVERVVKIRGFTIGGLAAEAMNPDVILDFIQALRLGNHKSKQVPQFRFKIDGVSRVVSSEQVKKIYSNMVDNAKRYLAPHIDKSKLFSYGTTTYL